MLPARVSSDEAPPMIARATGPPLSGKSTISAVAPASRNAVARTSAGRSWPAPIEAVKSRTRVGTPALSRTGLACAFMRRRKHWGWGYEDDAWSPQQLRAAAPGLEEHLRIAGDAVREPVALADVVLPVPRVAPPPALARICATDAHARASHAWGSSYSDVVRGFRGQFDFPPDVVA